jgi:hypothetical protein
VRGLVLVYDRVGRRNGAGDVEQPTTVYGRVVMNPGPIHHQLAAEVVEAAAGNGRAAHNLAQGHFGIRGLLSDQRPRPEKGRAKGIVEATAQFGRAAHNHHAAEDRAAVQVVHAAAGVFVGRAAAQAGGVAVGDSQRLNHRGHVAAEVEAAPPPFRVYDGGNCKILLGEVAVPTALNG